ncbi:unnamed protein product, partial [Staurois parvus]
MSCQYAPGPGYCNPLSGRAHLDLLYWEGLWSSDAPGTFFIGFFEFKQGHRGPIIPYCPGAP